MIKLRILIFALACGFLLGGCYEEKSEITLNKDGSGKFKCRLVISERLIVATSEEDGGKQIPGVSKDKVLKSLGSAIEIGSIKQIEQPDGGRIIEFDGTFSNAEQFFLSDFCRDTLKLRLSKTTDGQAVIYCQLSDISEKSSGPSTTQLYGLAKGKYVKRTIHLPANIEKTNGTLSSDKRTVSWSFDLRNKEGLARTKTFERSEDEGVGNAFFDASALEFALPLKTQKVSEETSIESQGHDNSETIEGLNAKISWVSIEQKIKLNNGSSKPETSGVELGIELSWLDGKSPYACKTPILTSITDDLNNDLVKKDFEFTHPIFDSDSKKELKVKTQNPGKNAQKIIGIEGYVRVIKSIKTEKVVLKNIYDLVGKDNTGNPVLDKLNFKVKNITGSSLTVVIEGGYNTIESLKMYGENGEPINGRGGSGWEINYTYDFASNIPQINKCEIEVIVSRDIIKVPFSLDEIEL